MSHAPRSRAGATSDRSRRWVIPAATIVLLVLGTIAVTTALTLWLARSDSDAHSRSPATTAPTAPPASPVPSVSGADASEQTTVPIGELAESAWVTGVATATGIPERALASYAGASIAANTARPGCGVGWNTLAAIGLVESEHGSLDKAEVADDGTVAPDIIGVPLDGNGVAEITDTDNGELDGDPTWDRAVGPMQFLPATWNEHATDGNGDGTPDVHNLDDAALTAALYLCASGGDLTQPENWISAVAAYNAGTDYNARVAEAAATYATAAEAR